MDTSDKVEWRIVYVTTLGAKKIGINPKDHFKFFKKDVFCLNPDYCAYLEYFDPLDSCWIILGQILVGKIYENYFRAKNTPEYEVSEFTIIDTTTGKILGRVKKGMICEYLQIHHPTPETFLNMIKEPIPV